MRLVALLLVLGCLAGCGGTIVLHKDSGGPQPQPVPAPAPHSHGYPGITREEAVQIVMRHATHEHVGRMRVEEIERRKHEWRVDLVGLDACGERVSIRAKVHRRTGELKSYKASFQGHHRHGKKHHDD